MWCATRGAVSMRWISKHADGITWMGQCTQGKERTQMESGFTFSNRWFGVAEPVSELSTYTISTRVVSVQDLRQDEEGDGGRAS